MGVGQWVSNALGLTTAGKVSIGSNASDALAVTGSAVVGGTVSAVGLTAEGPGGILLIRSTTAAANEGIWYFQALNPGLRWGAASDSFAVQDDWLTLSRTGADVTAVTLATPLLSTSRINSFNAQPGFLAYNSVDDSVGIGTFTVDFDNEVYDSTSNFAADTFTAPVTGIYHLCTSVSFSLGGSVFVRIVTSNRTYEAYMGSATNGTASLAVYADMDSGDTARVQIENGSGGSFSILAGTLGKAATFFSGRLVA
jgi:hypothetical protein